MNGVALIHTLLEDVVVLPLDLTTETAPGLAMLYAAAIRPFEALVKVIPIFDFVTMPFSNRVKYRPRAKPLVTPIS